MGICSLINRYMPQGGKCVTYTLGDTFSIIENPSFAVLPNHPYRSPLVVAIFCRKGGGVGRVNARTYNIQPGGFFIVQPGQITEFVDISDDFEAAYIIMTEEFTASLGITNTFNLRNTIVETPYALLGEQARVAIEGYIAMCENLIAVEANPHREEIVRLLTRAFFLGFGYFLHDANDARHSDSRADALTEEFIQLVEDNFREHRDLKFYADKLGLTPKHISYTVKQVSGKSAMEWIERYVTVEAIMQLTATNNSIKEIAYNLGFPSQSFFGKYFHRVTGLSPATYRKEHSLQS